MFSNAITGDKDSPKEHTIETGNQKVDADVCVSIHEAGKVRSDKLGDMQHDAFRALTNAVDCGEVVFCHFYGYRSIAEKMSCVACDTDVPVFSRARSTQATGELKSVLETINVAEKSSERIDDIVDNNVQPVREVHADGS